MSTRTQQHYGDKMDHIAYCSVNAVLLLSIIGVTYKIIIEHKKTQYMKSFGFVAVLLYCTTAFIGLSALFYKSLSELMSYNVQIANHNPFSFGCNAVFTQNTALMIALFVRIHCIFSGTPWQLSTATKRFFIISFIVSTVVFIILLTTTINHKMHETHSWFICAFTLCLFNVFFMIALTTLYLSKLKSVCKMYDQNKEFIDLIKKITILTLISMSITIFCCALLLLQETIWQNSYFVHVFSEWVVSINIYSNFVCFSLSFSFFAKSYSNLCQCMDSTVCKKLWKYVLFPTETPLATDSAISKCDVVGVVDSDVDAQIVPCTSSDQPVKTNISSKLTIVELLKCKFMKDDADIIIDMLSTSTSTSTTTIANGTEPRDVPKLNTAHSAPVVTSRTLKTRYQCNSMESI